LKLVWACVGMLSLCFVVVFRTVWRIYVGLVCWGGCRGCIACGSQTARVRIVTWSWVPVRLNSGGRLGAVAREWVVTHGSIRPDTSTGFVRCHLGSRVFGQGDWRIRPQTSIRDFLQHGFAKPKKEFGWSVQGCWF
jgi:hypothetical protein